MVIPHNWLVIRQAIWSLLNSLIVTSWKHTNYGGNFNFISGYNTDGFCGTDLLKTLHNKINQLLGIDPAE